MAFLGYTFSRHPPADHRRYATFLSQRSQPLRRSRVTMLRVFGKVRPNIGLVGSDYFISYGGDYGSLGGMDGLLLRCGTEDFHPFRGVSGLIEERLSALRWSVPGGGYKPVGISADYDDWKEAFGTAAGLGLPYVMIDSVVRDVDSCPGAEPPQVAIRGADVAGMRRDKPEGLYLIAGISPGTQRPLPEELEYGALRECVGMAMSAGAEAIAIRSLDPREYVRKASGAWRASEYSRSLLMVARAPDDSIDAAYVDGMILDMSSSRGASPARVRRATGQERPLPRSSSI